MSPSSNSMRGPSREEAAQNSWTKLPMGRGCSVGSLISYGEKGFLHNFLRLQEAIFSYPLFFAVCFVSFSLSLRAISVKVCANIVELGRSLRVCL